MMAEQTLDDGVDLGFLARKLKLAGGHIRNIALTAGFLAAEDLARRLEPDTKKKVGRSRQ